MTVNFQSQNYQKNTTQTQTKAKSSQGFHKFRQAEKDSQAMRVGGAAHQAHNRPSWSELQQLKGYTRRISAYKFTGNITKAEAEFERLKNDGLKPDVFIYSAIISVYARTKKLAAENKIKSIEILLKKMASSGIEANVVTYNCVIDAYAKAGNFSKVTELFEEMQKKGIEANVVTYNCVINAYAKAGNFEQVIALFQEMQKKGIEADVITYNCVIDAYAKAGNFEQVIALFKEMQKKGIKANVVTYNCVMDAYAKAGNFSKVTELLEEMQKKGIQADVVTYSCMMDAYAKAGNFSKVTELFEEMQKKGIQANVVTYNCVIDAYAKAGNFSKVTELLEEMQKKRIQANVVTYSCVMDAYAKAGDQRRVNQLRKEMESQGIAPNLMTHNAIMRLHATLKKPEEALKLLKSITQPDIITYNHFFDSLISNPQDLLIGKQWMQQTLPLYKQTQYTAKGPLVDCHDASYGAACFLIAFHLDQAVATQTHSVEVIVGQSHHSKTENIGKMFDITSEFIKKHYPNWNIQEPQPGRMTLTYLPLSSSSQKDLKQSAEIVSKISSSPPKDVSRVYHTTTRSALQAIESLEKEDLDPSIDLYNNLFECCETEMKAELAKEQVQKMLQRYVQPNANTYKTLLSLYTQAYALDDAMACFSDLQDTGMIGDKAFLHHIEKTAPALFTTLIDRLVAAGKYKDAVHLLDILWYWQIPCNPQPYDLLIEVYQQEERIFRQQEQLRELFAKTSSSLESAAPDQSAIKQSSEKAADLANSCLATIRDLRYTQRNLISDTLSFMESTRPYPA